jgi:uncharacterized membrane protein YkvA (DUF1232 family)
MRRFSRLVAEVNYYKTLANDPAVPRASKWLLAAAIGYLVSPIDLIPDFIPILGQLDDLVVVPLLVWLALRLVPTETKMRIRNELATHT